MFFLFFLFTSLAHAQEQLSMPQSLPSEEQALSPAVRGIGFQNQGDEEGWLWQKEGLIREEPIATLLETSEAAPIEATATAPRPSDSESLSPVQVDLRNPTYHNGVLYTKEGGVIKNGDLRIQAKVIQYIRKMENGKLSHRLEAEGDLMVQYKGRVYVGRRLEYDFNTRSGVIYQGKTFAYFWYIGGDEILINPDGSFKVVNAFITTCENAESAWDIHAGRVDIFRDDLMSAKNVKFRLFQIPAFWLPSFKVNLKNFKEPIFRYALNWDKASGPRAEFRYQLYSWRDFALYGRLEYRLSTGFGGAIETEYFPPDKKITFVTRSYLATDILETAPDRMQRYRVEGAYKQESEDGRTRTCLTWDKYSDVRMPGDFKSEDFEVNTAGRTLFYLYHQHPMWISSLKVRPKVNPFESIQQDLPTLFFSNHPMEMGHSGIFHTGVAKLSYLNFSYSTQLTESLNGFRSARLEAREIFYRPTSLGPCTFTPHLGGVGIFYSRSPSHHSKMMALFTYGGSFFARGVRDYTITRHVLEPYFSYIGLSHPTTSPNSHYIFTIQDGYQTLNELRLGLRNLFFSRRHPRPDPSWTADLHTNLFFFDSPYQKPLQKLYFDLTWALPSMIFDCQNIWNMRHNLMDRSILRCRLTLSENIAMSLEGRYRSKYDWRKADQENFVLDASRSESELLLSPISDQRVTLLANLFIRPSPFWECHIQSHHGFDRIDENPYNEVKIDLFTWISSALKLRVSYSHTEKDDRFTAGIALDKR